MAKRNFYKRSAQKRYKSQRFQNPYFREEKKFPWKLLFIALAFVLTLLFVIWFFLGSSYFHITSVQVTGCEVIDEQELTQKTQAYLDQRALLIFSRANRFLFYKEALYEHLSAQYAFESFESTIRQKTLFLTIEERTSTFIWNTETSWFVFDLNGVLVRYLTPEELNWLQNPTVKEGPLQVDEEGHEIIPPIEIEKMTPEEIFQTYPIMKDLNEIEVEIGEQVLEAEAIEAIVDFLQRVEDLGIVVQEIHIDRLAGKWTGLLTQEEYLILFDTDGDRDEQVSHLSTLLKESIDDTKMLEYIDVRFGDHLYFKYQE
jgi:hypothetical protein